MKILNITIKSCSDCPYYHLDYLGKEDMIIMWRYQCEHPNLEKEKCFIDKNIIGISDWCPLPDLPERMMQLSDYL